MYYNSVPVSFLYENNLVTGILSGSWFEWEFRSQSPSFIAFFPDGIFNRKVHLDGHHDPRHKLVEATLSALDKQVAIIS